MGFLLLVLASIKTIMLVRSLISNIVQTISSSEFRLHVCLLLKHFNKILTCISIMIASID
jgi:hypothetical protein